MAIIIATKFIDTKEINMTVYFLGGGNMATAIIAGMKKHGGFDIVVIGRNAQKQQYLSETYGIKTQSALPVLSAEDVLILAVKPQDMFQALANIADNGALILSVAAGLDIHTLSSWLNGTKRIIRIMPNTPCQIGLGMSGLFAHPSVSQQDKEFAATLMQTTGEVIWLHDEAGINRIGAISGSGPAYVFYFMQALQAAAQQQGFNQEEAYKLTLSTFKGAVALAEQSGLPVTQLRTNVTSKGGTTLAATSVFDEHHLMNTISEGISASVQRAEAIQNELKSESTK